MDVAGTERGRQVLGQVAGAFADGPDPLVVYVSDNGIGIAPEDREQVFRVFCRLHPKDAFGGGAGAGLTIVRRIVERHGGVVWIEAAPEGGARVCFTVER